MKKNKYTLALLVMFLSMHHAFSQYNFQRVIGGNRPDRAQTIFSTFDNGFLVNGASFSFGIGSVDMVLVKTDNQGQTLWSYAYGTTEYDNSEYSIETFDHNIVTSGRSNVQPGMPTSAILFKTDSAGNLLWSKKYGGTGDDDLVDIIETSDHGYAAVGFSKTLSSGSSDIFFIRTDLNGDTLFTRSYGSIEQEEGSSIIQLPDGGFLITGRQVTYVGSMEADGLLLRTDASGNLLWSKQYGDSLWEELSSVRLLPDSGFIFSGSTVTFGAGNYDILLMKTDSGGNVQWSETFGDYQTDAGYDVHVNSDNSYVLSGYTEDLGYGHTRGDDSSNIFLLKTDVNGNLLWMEIYGDGLQDEGFRSAKASDGGYLIPGFTNNYVLNDSNLMLFIKTDSMGLTGCHEESVQPIDSFITMPYHSVNFSTLSGIPTDTLILTRTVITPINDNACLIASVNSGAIKEKELNVFPDPFQDNLKITFNGNISSDDRIIISDMYGKCIKSMKLNAPELSIETSDMVAGVYFISLNNNSEYRKAIVVVKY